MCARRKDEKGVREGAANACVGVVGGPRVAEGLLAADVPHEELDVAVRELLDVAADRRRRRDDLSEAQAVHDRRLARVVQAHEHDLELGRAKRRLPQPCEQVPHPCPGRVVRASHAVTPSLGRSQRKKKKGKGHQLINYGTSAD